MSDKDARAFITQVAPLGIMDYSLLQKRPPMIGTKYGFSLLVPPTTLVIGIVVIIQELLLEHVCKLNWPFAS